MKLLIIILVLCMPIIVHSEISTIWMVWGTSATRTTQDSLKSYGKTDQKEAVKNTRLVPLKSNYLLTISTMTDDENKNLLEREFNKEIVKVGEVEYKRIYDPVSGETVSTVEYRMNKEKPHEISYEYLAIQEEK